jgi:hypothetical protein
VDSGYVLETKERNNEDVNMDETFRDDVQRNNFKINMDRINR